MKTTPPKPLDFSKGMATLVQGILETWLDGAHSETKYQRDDINVVCSCIEELSHLSGVPPVERIGQTTQRK